MSNIPLERSESQLSNGVLLKLWVNCATYLCEYTKISDSLKPLPHGGWAYFAPLFDGERPGALLARVKVKEFSPAHVEFLDLKVNKKPPPVKQKATTPQALLLGSF